MGCRPCKEPAAWVARAAQPAGLPSAVVSKLESLVAALAWEGERKVSTAWELVLVPTELAEGKALSVSVQTVWRL